MPVYFFRCASSDGDHSDIWGMTLADTDAALAMAVGEARSLGDRLRQTPSAHRYRFEIEDEDGMPIMHVPLASCWDDEGRPNMPRHSPAPARHGYEGPG